jgi:hypothetical protein
MITARCEFVVIGIAFVSVFRERAKKIPAIERKKSLAVASFTPKAGLEVTNQTRHPAAAGGRVDSVQFKLTFTVADRQTSP